MILKHIIYASALLLLTACASHSEKIDPPVFKAAIQKVEPQGPMQIVQIPKPLPLPGQLKKVPSKPKKAERYIDPIESVDATNETSRLEPTGSHINAIQVYPYTKGALYRLYAAPEQVTDIALQPGEQLISAAAGDTVRWVVGDTTSGEGETSQVHILVKPIETDLKTNLVITTDRRTYHLELESLYDTYMAAVSWNYPHDQLLSLQGINAQHRLTSPIARGLQLNDLSFAYAISGDKPKWRPIRAFDDGRKVYIQFPQDFATTDAPPLFVMGAGKDPELVNYRVRGRYYIVDRLFDKAELRLGEKRQDKVRITKKD